MQHPPAQIPRSRRFKFLRVTGALMLREFVSQDNRAALSFLWQVLEPVASIVLLTVVFQAMTRHPPLGTNFPLYYVTGVLPFQLFMTVSNKVSSAVKFSRPLLEFPAVRVIDAIIARFVLNVVIEISVFLVLIFLIAWYYDLTLIVDVPRATLAMTLSASLALGIGAFNSVLFLAFPLYEKFYSVVTRPLMIVSGVLFQTDGLPVAMQAWVWWNPVAHPVALMRGAFYSGADLSEVSPLYVFSISGVAFVLGLITLHRFFRDALER